MLDDDIVALAKNFVAIPSVTGDTKRAAEVLELAKQQLPGYRPTSFIDDNYVSLLYSNQKRGAKKFKIIFNAHLDVVPATDSQFQPLIKNGRLYGRGAYDTKAAAAVMILVFKELAGELSYPLGLQLTTDEEVSGEFGTGHQIKQGVRCEFGVIGESNNDLRVTNESKGRKLIKIVAFGQSTHSAYPWLGENPTIQMHKILGTLYKNFPPVKKETPATTVSVVKIETDNDATNQIPGTCTAYIDVRYVERDKNTIANKITSLLPKNIGLVITEKRIDHFVDPKNPYVTMLRQETRKVHKKTLPLRLAHGTSDAPFFTEVGCNAVEFGPIGHGAHHDDEWVDINSLGEYYQILKNFLLEVDKRNSN